MSAVFPAKAPVMGLRTSDALADMMPEAALVLENFIPYANRVELRRGSTAFATGLGADVETIAPFQTPSGAKLFAFAGTNCYAIEAGGAVGAAEFTTTSARWQFQQFATSAVDALVLVNGADQMRQWYSGAWTAVATVGTGGDEYDTTTFALVCAYKQRLYFGLEGRLEFVYLPAGSIAGATAAKFQISQLCPKGGYLVLMDTWSVDSGSGPDDYLVLVTSEGEAVVYKGTDPSDATKWFHVGTYQIGAPMGPRASAKIGGDLWIMTKTGIVSLTKAMKSGQIRDKELVSYPIQPDYEEAVRLSSGTEDWQLQPLFDQGLVIASVQTSNTRGAQFVFQTGSGSWSKFTGWPARSLSVFNSYLYAGVDGKVLRCLDGTSDEGNWIEGQLLTAYNYFKLRGRRKHVKGLRLTFSTDVQFAYQLGLHTDFKRTGYTSQIGGPSVDASLWDAANWDTAIWAGGDEVQQAWKTVANQVGYCHSLALRLRSKLAQPSLLSIEYLYEPAGVF